MKLIEGNLYLDWAELTGYGYSMGYLKKATHKARAGYSKSYQNIKDPADNRISLVLYDSIPSDSIEYKSIPSKDELIRQVQRVELEKLIVKDPKVLTYYLNSPASQQAEELQEFAAWLMVCAPTNRSTARSMGFDSVDIFYQEVMQLLNDKQIKAPSNLRRFKDKIKPFYQYLKQFPTHFDPDHKDYYLGNSELNDAYEQALKSILSKKYGKKNAARLTTRNDERGARQAEEQQALLVRLYGDPKKLTIQDTYNNYNKVAIQKYQAYMQTNGADGWDDKCLMKSVQTVKNFLYRPEIKKVWYSNRHGIKEANNVFEKITKRRTASFANAKWIIDGTPVHMYFQKDGQPYQRINVFPVLDEYSYCVVGYQIAFTETSDLVIKSLRDACQRTNLMPYEIQSDNSKAIQAWHSQNAIKTISEYYIPARVGNARSKKIESWFSHFNNRILKYKPGYIGNPLANSIDRRPNTEALLAQVKNGLIPSLSEALRILDDAFNEWNSHEFNGAIPLQKYWESVKETQNRQRVFSHAIDVKAFWHTPGKKRQIDAPAGSKQKKITTFEPTVYQWSSRGIVVQRKDQETNEINKYIFDTNDLAINERHLGDSFTLKIEPENFDKAILYTPEGRPILNKNNEPLTLGRKEEYSSAMVDRLPGEGQKLHQELEAKKQMSKISEARFEKFIKVAKESGTYAPIDATTVHGKEIQNNAKAELSEGLVNRLKTPVQEDEETEEITLNRFNI